MSKIISFSCVNEQAIASESEILKNIFSDIPHEPESGMVKAIQRTSGSKRNDETGDLGIPGTTYKRFPQTREEAIRTLTAIALKIIIDHMADIFVDITLSEFTVNTLRKHRKNAKLFDFINNNIKMVYKKHPDYRPCTAKEFRMTGIWQHMLSEWRHGDTKQKAKYVAKHSFDNLITIVLVDIIPIPGVPQIVSPIVKASLQYIGADLLLRPLYNLVFEIDGQTISFGITYSKAGIVLSDLILYTFNKEGKLVANHLETPPQSLYRITEKDARAILNKMGWDASLDKLKEEVKGRGK